MNSQIRIIIGLSCMIPAIIGLVKVNRISSKYYPFVFMMILDVIIEMIDSFTAVKKFDNIYTVATFGIFLFFVNTNKYLSTKWLEIFLGSAIVLITFSMIQNGVLSALSYYQVCFTSIVILFISIDILTSQVFSIRSRLVKNFWFWFSIGSTLMYGYSLLLFGLYFFTLKNTPQGKAIGDIWIFVNLACYTLYTIAILKIPETKPSFTYKKENLINHV